MQQGLEWERDDYTGVYVATAPNGTHYSINNEQGGWIVYVRADAPDLTTYPMKLGRQMCGDCFPSLGRAKYAATQDYI